MSRIGVMPIAVPAKVTVKVDNNTVFVKGPKGELSEKISPLMVIENNKDEVIVKRPDDSKQAKSLHGLSRTLINNMIIGVTEGFSKALEINGVGYRAKLKGKDLELNVGLSHEVIVKAEDGISFEVPNQLSIIIKGINKQIVGSYAAKVRGIRPPEPYKGKGIKYVDEHITRKEGKTGAS